MARPTPSSAPLWWLVLVAILVGTAATSWAQAVDHRRDNVYVGVEADAESPTVDELLNRLRGELNLADFVVVDHLRTASLVFATVWFSTEGDTVYLDVYVLGEAGNGQRLALVPHDDLTPAIAAVLVAEYVRASYQAYLTGDSTPVLLPGSVATPADLAAGRSEIFAEADPDTSSPPATAGAYPSLHVGGITRVGGTTDATGPAVGAGVRWRQHLTQLTLSAPVAHAPLDAAEGRIDVRELRAELSSAYLTQRASWAWGPWLALSAERTSADGQASAPYQDTTTVVWTESIGIGALIRRAISDRVTIDARLGARAAIDPVGLRILETRVGLVGDWAVEGQLAVSYVLGRSDE